MEFKNEFKEIFRSGLAASLNQLYNMVRTMVGEMLDLAWGKRSLESLQKAYETGDRSLLGKTMPAKGLTLMQVDYKI